MQFSRLKLNGFKSFVDPTDLVIQEGLSGVVGPNGCGKSNLLEALRWVMGENRPSAMRGGGMEDVIFAGASTRPARNFAEVVLQIDNSERLAPAGFNDEDTLEVTRRITRDAGSAYKANTKDVRARDIQMLFADASTGSHSPALVRQGQISELINSKPKARRRILEEAAGISGLYQRRHEAELKLKGAENNLTRVDDVIEQLAAQLAQLARQARQAERYRTIGADLRKAEGILLFRRWKEAEEGRLLADNQLREATVLASKADSQVREKTKQRELEEGKLPALREEKAIGAALLQRLQVQRDTLTDQEKNARQMIARLESRIEQLARDKTRENGLNHDAQETIGRLEWEQEQLSKAADGYEEKLSIAEAESRGGASILQEREDALSQLTEDVARLAARHQSAHRLLDDTRKILSKNESDADRAREEVLRSREARAQAQDRLNASTVARDVAQTKAEETDIALNTADLAREAAQELESDARAERSEAEGEANALRAETAALTRLVERDTGEHGQLLDEVKVVDGYEQALGAALADDLKAPEVAPDVASGWAALHDYEDDQGLPDGAMPLALHVSVPGVLSRRMGQVGLVPREAGPKLQSALKPGQRLVSREGDLWRWDGFRLAAGDAPSAAAMRLQQLNRLAELTRSLNAATKRAATAVQTHEDLTRQLVQRTEADRAAREARKLADRSLADATRAMSSSEAELSIAAGKMESLGLAVERFEEEALGARRTVEEAEAQVAGLGDLDAARASVEDIKLTVEAARMTMMSKRSSYDELRREGEARLKRRQEITKEISGWRLRLQTAEQQLSEIDERRLQSEAELKEASTAPAELAAKRDELSDAIAEAEERRRLAGDKLAQGETTLRDASAAERAAERTLSEAREVRARGEARSEAAREAVAHAEERIDEEQECTAAELLETLDIDPDRMPVMETIEADVARLKRQREALGAVNLRAEEDSKEVREEHVTLVAEKTDLEDAIKALRSGIASLNKEGRERLLKAFDQVNSNFSVLFTHLFGGGEAKLVLVESDDPLEAGLEIMCQPPGKKLSTLSLLSGGEQTLTAMALIFAVFLANPAPICVLDEVDAPLDDANVTRFCDLLDEMCRRTKTRFLIITHHAVTMARMDRLFGVTMAEQGVSQLVSVDLKKASAMVA